MPPAAAAAASVMPCRGLLPLRRMVSRCQVCKAPGVWTGLAGRGTTGASSGEPCWRSIRSWQGTGRARPSRAPLPWMVPYSSASGGEAGGSEAPSSYWTLSKEHHYTLEAKKSKFVTTAWPIQSGKQALELVQTHKDPMVSHNCFAYKAGSEYRSSDDGEPGGTAGRPMLSAIEGEGLDFVCVMVTRYYGGTKLGAGGLVRAYGGAARECLRGGTRELVTAKAEVQFDVPFEMIGSCYGALDKHQGLRLQEDYSENGATVTARVEADQVDSLTKALQDVTSGAVELHILQ